MNIIKEASNHYIPLVSVVIPVYNAEKYLHDCIRSLLKQTLKEIEIICVDDGSTDNSLKILKRYAEKDKRITLITQENQYAGVARNNGFKFARGKYVIFLDADDFFEDKMLEATYKKAEFEQSEICIFGVNSYDHKTKQRYNLDACIDKYVPEGKAVVSGKELGKNLFVTTCAAPWNKLYLREFVQKYNLQFQDIRVSNDLTFTFTSIALAEKITFFPYVLMYYRIGTGSSLQQTRHDKDSFAFFDTFDHFKRSLVDYNIYDDFSVPFANISCNHMWFNLIHSGDFETFKEMYKRIKENAIKDYDINILNIQNIINIDAFMMLCDVVKLDTEQFSQKYKIQSQLQS